MGNGNTRPAKALTGLKKEGVPSAQRPYTDRPGRTTAATILDSNSSPPAYTKEHLVAPSSNPYPPATPPAPFSNSNGDNSSDPSLALPVRIVFSASFERSLQSSGKRRPSALRSSSSWTEGPLTRDSKKSTADKTTSTISTETTQLTRKRLGAPTHSAGVRASRRGNRGITKRTASPLTTWKHSRDNHSSTSSSAVDRHSEGGTTTVVESIIDTNRGSPARPRRGRRNLHDPPSTLRPSAAAAAVVVGASRGLVRKQGEKNQAEKRWVESSTARQSSKQQQHEECDCKGGSEQQHSSRSVPRSGEDTLPTVKCWEGSATVAAEGEVSRGGGETRIQRPRQRPGRSRSSVDTASPQRAGDKGKTSTGNTDGRNHHDTKEEGSSGIAVVGRNSEGVGFGRESNSSSRFRLQGRGGGAGVRAALANDAVSVSGGSSSGMLLGDDRKPASSPPPLLQLPVSSTAEDATCCDLEDNLSVCSSLPPMTGSATITTDLIFEESSLEDSGASVSQASSTERNWNDVVVVGGGGGGCVAKSEGGGGGVAGRGKRGGGGGGSRQRSGGSSEAFVRTRSVGRGLSSLMARIHEQEECRGGGLDSPRDPLPRGIGSSRPSTGETFRVQELSDSDHDGHEAVLATPPLSSSPTADLNVASAVTNVGHQRAALELRNLTLEREVEQLKTHLRSLGGDDVTISDFHGGVGVRRPRPRPQHQHRVGEQARLHRSVAPSPLSEASASVSHRGAGGGSGIGCRSGVSDVSARGRAEAGRARRGDSTAVHSSRTSAAGGGGGGGGASALTVYQKTAGEAEATAQPAPSPPRKRGSSRRASAAAIESSSASSSSPARQLRTTRLRSPTSASAAAAVEVLSPQAGKQGEAAGLLAIGDGGLEAGGGTSQISVNKNDDESVQELGQALGQEPLGGVAEPRSLPRLRREEAERRRALKTKPRAAKTPINLGGMVSGIKHTLLSRRRSTGDKNAQLVTAAGNNLSVVRGSQIFGGNKSAGDGDRPLAIVDGDKPTRLTAVAGKESDQPENRTRSSRRPTQGGENHPSSAASSSKGTAPSASAAAPPAVERGRDAAGGRREVGRAAVEAREERPPGVVSTKQAAAVVTDAAATEAYDETVGGTEGTGVATATECGARGGGAGVVSETGDAGNDSPIYGRWPATLDAQWAEVEFMLCHEVDCEESLQYTIEATEAGLVFMDKLEEKAQELGILKGQLSRWLLPFNTDTSVDEQQAATPRRFQESLLASSATSRTAGGSSGGTLTEEEAEYLTAGARRVRQLVRLKIADDNDLNTAKEALVTMAGFFVSISEEAAKRGGSATPFSVLQERRAMSPITRPPPLPSIPRPCTATQAAATTKANDDATTASLAGARQSDGGGGRGTSRTPAPTIKPPSATVEFRAVVVPAAGRASREVGGRSGPEASAGRNHGDTFLPLAADDGASAAAAGHTPREGKVTVEDTAPSVTSAPEPEEVNTTPRDVSRECTPATANDPKMPGSLGAVGGSPQGQVAGTAESNTSGSIVSASALSTRGDDHERGAASPSPNLAEHRLAGKAVAPAESLVRLKRRRQLARTRSNSQR